MGIRVSCSCVCICRSPSLGLPQLGALPPPFPVSRPPGGLNLVTHRGGGSGSGFSPGPTHLEPVATPPSHQDYSGENPFTAPGRGEFP